MLQWSWTTLFLAAVAFSQEVSPEATNYLVKTWQTEEGLPQNSVAAIMQTQDGYLWLGTFNGLARFDGVKFDVFTVGNTPSLLADNINVLYEDQAGRMWIGTDGGGLIRYDHGVFTPITHASNPAEAIIERIGEDEEHRLWVATGRGLHRLAGETLVETTASEDQTPLGSIAAMQSDRGGQLWLATTNGVFICKKGKLARVSNLRGVQQIGCGSFAGVWCSDPEVGLVRLEPGKEIVYPEYKGFKCRCIWETRNGDLWLGSDTAGLSRWRAGKRTNYTVQTGLLSNDICAIYEDREGNLWIGTNGGGLHRLQRPRLACLSTANGLPGNDVVCLLEGRDDRVWIGMFDQGVTVLEKGKFQRLPQLPAGPASVIALCQSQDGSVWLGGADGRLLHWSKAQVSEENLSAFQGARTLFEDRTGGLWIGSRRQGVECRRSGATVRYATQQGLSHDYVTSIAQDLTGDMWIGTRLGLNRLHNDAIQRFSRQDGLGAEAIHTLFVDSRGQLWVGTAGGGLSRYKEGHFATLTEQQGLYNNVIAQILEDDRGFLWFGSNAGIFRVNTRELEECADGRLPSVHSLVFNRNAGMLNPECAGSFQPACFKARDGRLWFATVGGVAIVEPEKLSLNSLPPPVCIQSVMVDGHRKDSIAAIPTPHSKITIAPGASRLQIAFSALSFTAPDQVRFRFKLGGIDKDWIEAGARRSAYYTYLPPGTYRFQVLACNNDGLWNPQAAALDLVLQPFWWQTAWFTVACALGLAGLGALVARWIGARKLQRELAQAEQRNLQRHAEELGAANRQLEGRTKQLEEALANVKLLGGLLPICARCKKIRDDSGYWNRVETYIELHTDATFTHSICPECVRILYPGVGLKKD